MLTKNEYFAGLFGAFRLALFKLDGMLFFPSHLTLALRSFQTLFAFIPLWMYLNRPSSMDMLNQIGFSYGSFLAFTGVQYIIALFVQLLVTYAFAKQLRVAQYFYAYVSANNWTSLLSVLVLIPLQYLASQTLPPDGAWREVYMASVQAAMLLYAWFVLTASLRLKPNVALGLALLQFILYYGVQISMSLFIALAHLGNNAT